MGAGEEEFALAGVAGEGSGASEFGLGFGEAAEFEEEVAADAGQEMVRLERGLGGECVQEFEARGGTEGHGEGDGAIQFYDGRGREVGERLVERHNARPVGFFGSTRSRVARGDGGLERVWAGCAVEFFGAVERGETAVDEELIPAGAVLLK
jgi:hypothetical protein